VKEEKIVRTVKTKRPDSTPAKKYKKQKKGGRMRRICEKTPSPRKTGQDTAEVGTSVLAHAGAI